MGMTRSEAGKLGYLKSKEKQAQLFEQRKTEHKGDPCGWCSAPITYENRANLFCGHSCAASFHNSKRVLPRPCKVCSTEFKPSLNQKKTCSDKCRVLLRSVSDLDAWLAGDISGGTWRGVFKFVKKWLVDQYGNKCSECGWCQLNKFSNRVPVQVDHIDGNPENHRPENLRLLCPNCHSLTGTYGGLNRGKGRAARYSADKKTPPSAQSQ